MNAAELLSSGRRFLTFAGVETHLIYVQHHELREFSAFEVLDDQAAWDKFLQGFLVPIADTAAKTGCGLITDSLGWRASTDYVERLGHGERGVAAINKAGIERVKTSISDWRAARGAAATECPVILAGDLGPRGDGYQVQDGGAVSVDVAQAYHAPQVEAIAEAGADLLVAYTMTSANESIGVVRAAQAAGLPVVISPTLDTDGRLPDGTSLGDTISRVDDVTGGAAVCYMVNCVHPLHVEPVLTSAGEKGEAWLTRLRGLRANASTLSHEALDAMTELDRGDILDLSKRMGELSRRFDLLVVGGCCGTDAEHISAIAAACQQTH